VVELDAEEPPQLLRRRDSKARMKTREERSVRTSGIAEFSTASLY